MSWGYLSGLLRAEKVNALTDNDFNTFAETSTVETLTRSLDETIYGESFQGRSLKEFTVIFDELYQQKLLRIKELAPCPIVMLMQDLKVDLNNLKLCYKAKLLQKEIVWERLSEGGTIAPERIYTIVEQELWSEFPAVISNALILLQEYSKDNVRKVDFLLDSAYYAYRLEVLTDASVYESKYYQPLVDLYRVEIDCENIKNLLRAKTLELDKEQITEIIIPNGTISLEFFSDHANLSIDDVADLIKNTVYGDVFAMGVHHWNNTKSCTTLEKQIDEFLLSKVREFAYISEGPAVVEEAIRSLQIEIKNLKLIIIGKLNNMAIEEIKERVRYVSA